MKQNKVLLLMAAAVMLNFAACTSEKGDESEDPGQKANTEANLKTFEAFADGETHYAADILGGGADRRAEFTIDPADNAGMANATIKATASEGATILVNGAAIEAGQYYDLTASSFKITVTSEDTKTVNEYKVVITELQYTFTCTSVWEKGASKVNANQCSYNGCSVAFCAKDKIAFLDGTVVNLEGNKMGTLCFDGCPSTQLYNIVNDDNGVLVGSFAMNGDDNGWATITNYSVWAWLDGWFSEPTCIFSEVSDEAMTGGCYRFLCCSGALGEQFIFTFITGGQENGDFRIFVFDGDIEECTEYSYYSNYLRADGCWFQQLVCANTDLEGTWYIGDGYPFDQGCSEFGVYQRTGGLDFGSDIEFYGYGEMSGNHLYGNYVCGWIEPFTYGGTDFVAVASTGWESGFLTVQTSDPNDEEHYLLPTYALNEGMACNNYVQYVYDDSDDTGYLVYLSGKDGSDSGQIEKANTVALFSIQREAY